VSYVPGTIFHLWHGDRADLAYAVRNRELASFQFDPAKDLRLGDSGCWEWAQDNPGLRAWGARYFASRREDGLEEGEAGDYFDRAPAALLAEAR
jgi:hypothetical protein